MWQKILKFPHRAISALEHSVLCFVCKKIVRYVYVYACTSKVDLFWFNKRLLSDAAIWYNRDDARCQEV